MGACEGETRETNENHSTKTEEKEKHDGDRKGAYIRGIRKQCG